MTIRVLEYMVMNYQGSSVVDSNRATTVLDSL